MAFSSLSSSIRGVARYPAETFGKTWRPDYISVLERFGPAPQKKERIEVSPNKDHKHSSKMRQKTDT